MLFLWKLPLISCVDWGSYSLEASEHEWIESSYALVSLGTYIGGGYIQGSFDGVQFYMTLLYLFRPLIRKGQVHFPWGLPEHFCSLFKRMSKAYIGPYNKTTEDWLFLSPTINIPLSKFQIPDTLKIITTVYWWHLDVGVCVKLHYTPSIP